MGHRSTDCYGGLLCSYVPERLLHAQGTPRCIFMVLVSLASTCVVCFNAFASLPMLFPASILAGTAFGAHWSLMATLTSEFFGLHHFASNYTFIQVSHASACVGCTVTDLLQVTLPKRCRNQSS